MNLLDFFKAVNEWLKKLDENPIVNHFVDWLGDFLMGRHFFKTEMVNGQPVRVINPEWWRHEAPEIWATTFLDETMLREITYSGHLSVDHRVDLFDNWGPDTAVANPDPLQGQVGPNQWDDIRLGLVSELVKNQETGEQLQGDERERKIASICSTLTEIAKLDNYYKLQRFVKMHYCRPREDDYRIVKIRRFFHWAGTNMRGLLLELYNWLRDPSPTGFRALATMAAAGVRTITPEVRSILDNVATALNNHATRVAPRGLLGRLIR